MRSRIALSVLLAVTLVACGGDADPGPTEPPGGTQAPQDDAGPGDTAPEDDGPGTTESVSSQPDISLSSGEAPPPDLVADFIADNARQEWGTPSGVEFTSAGEEVAAEQLQFWICDSFGYDVVDATEATFLAAFWSEILPHPEGGTDGSQTVMLRILFNPTEDVLPDVLARIHSDEECQHYDAINLGTGEWTFSTESNPSGLRMSTAAANENVDHATQNFVGTHRGTVFNAQVRGMVMGGETLDLDVGRMLDDVIDLAVAALDQ